MSSAVPSPTDGPGNGVPGMYRGATTSGKRNVTSPPAYGRTPQRRQLDRRPFARHQVADPQVEDAGAVFLSDRRALALGDRSFVLFARLSALFAARLR